jgi:hypothetical protein
MYGEAGRGKGQGQRRGNGGGGGDDWKNQKSRLQMALEEDAHEATLGYANFTEGEERLGWLMNVSAVRPRFPNTDVSSRLVASSACDARSSPPTDHRPTPTPSDAYFARRRREILFSAFLNFSTTGRARSARRRARRPRRVAPRGARRPERHRARALARVSSRRASRDRTRRALVRLFP